MSNLQLIDELCQLVERQNAMLRKLAFDLEQARSLTEEDRKRIFVLESKYSDILGADELPDDLP